MAKRSKQTFSSPSTTKGNLLEEVTARLHQHAGASVEQKVKLSVVGDDTQFREIDVLITGKVAGYPLRIAIECKNYDKRIGVDKIGEFIDKLEDVGIPPQSGVFVAVKGFTRDALRRASKVGIRPLVLKGLTADRLAKEVFKAVQSVVYLLPEVASITINSEVDQDGADDLFMLLDTKGNPCGYLWDLIWSKWRSGEIPFELGTYEIALDLPPGWRWAAEGEVLPNTAQATVAVRGLVISVPGHAEHLALSHAASGELERHYVSVAFESGPKTYPVNVVETEANLGEALAGPVPVNLALRIPLPRILWTMMYWPPSDRSLSLLAWHANEIVRQGRGDLSALSKLSLQDIEGRDLSAAWELISVGHPALYDPEWPYASN